MSSERLEVSEKDKNKNDFRLKTEEVDARERGLLYMASMSQRFWYNNHFNAGMDHIVQGHLVQLHLAFEIHDRKL